jgi:hypothetical protein
MEQPSRIKNSINLVGKKFNPLSNIREIKDPAVRIIPRYQERLSNTKRAPRRVEQVRETFINNRTIDNAYLPGDSVQDQQFLYNQNGFTDLVTTYTIGEGDGNGYINAPRFVQPRNFKSINKEIEGIKNTDLDGVASIPEDENGPLFNKKIQDEKLNQELLRRNTMISDFQKYLHSKRPPGSIQSTANSRS